MGTFRQEVPAHLVLNLAAGLSSKRFGPKGGSGRSGQEKSVHFNPLPLAGPGQFFAALLLLLVFPAGRPAAALKGEAGRRHHEPRRSGGVWPGLTRDSSPVVGTIWGRDRVLGAPGPNEHLPSLLGGLRRPDAHLGDVLGRTS